MVPQPRRSEGADRTLAAVLQRAAAAQRPWLQTTGDRSPELGGTRYHSPQTHCLIGYKFHTQVNSFEQGFASYGIAVAAGPEVHATSSGQVPKNACGDLWARNLVVGLRSGSLLR